MIHVDLLAKFVIAKFVFPNLDLMSDPNRQTSGFDITCYTMCITHHSKVQHHTYCASWLYLFASVAMIICPVNGIERRRSANDGR